MWVGKKVLDRVIIRVGFIFCSIVFGFFLRICRLRSIFVYVSFIGVRVSGVRVFFYLDDYFVNVFFLGYVAEGVFYLGFGEYSVFEGLYYVVLDVRSY